MSDDDNQINKIEELMREMGYKDADVAEMREYLQPPKKLSLNERKTQALTRIETYLTEEVKPYYIRAETISEEFPYPTDIRVEWRKNTLFFIKQLFDPNDGEFFEHEYAKMSLRAKNSFNLAYHRHTGAYFILYYDISLDECLKALETNMLLQP